MCALNVFACTESDWPAQACHSSAVFKNDNKSITNVDVVRTLGNRIHTCKHRTLYFNMGNMETEYEGAHGISPEQNGRRCGLR
jgi:nitrate reductase beta subunit